MKNLRFILRWALPPLLAWLFIWINPFELPDAVCKTFAMMGWMLIWWLMESVPMPVTALLPILMFPILGISSMEEACAPYGDKFVFLFLGGFILALALEKTGLHKRFSLNLVKLTGTGSNQIILGFMLSSYFISMWISNTATTLMMFPIAQAVSQLFETDEQNNRKAISNFRILLFLAIAYSSSIGGMATLIGTPPNAASIGILSGTFHREVTFWEFMQYGLPFSLALLLIAYVLLTRLIFPVKLSTMKKGKAFLQSEIDRLGKMQSTEWIVVGVFSLAVLLWLTEGWMRGVFPGYPLSDVWIAMAAGTTLFLIPDKEAKPVLVWEDTQKLPWGILLMFGGGLSLAMAFKSSGTLDMLTNALQLLNHLNTFTFMAILAGVGLLLTAFMSNLAMVTIFVPVVASLALSRGVDPLLFALPVTLSASCDFMFPMSTPPNAIAFSSGHIKAVDMFKAGIVLNLISYGLLMALIALSL